MKKVVLDFVNKLEGYKTAVKSLHWSSSNMSEHELFDKIADSVKDIQDVVSESEQGMTSPLANNKLKPIPYKITTSKKFLDDLSKTAIEFRNKINGDGYIGMRSAVEAFISEVDVFKYQLTICLKEDFERRMNRNRVRLTESQLHRVVKESVKKVLRESGETPEGAYRIGQLSGRNHLLDRGDVDDIYERHFGDDAEFETAVNSDEYWQGFYDYLEQAYRNYIKAKGFDYFARTVSYFIINHTNQKEMRAFLSEIGINESDFMNHD